MALNTAAAIAALNAGLSGVNEVEWAVHSGGPVATTIVPVTTVTMENAVDMTTFVRKGIDVAAPPQLSDQATQPVVARYWRFRASGTPRTSWNKLNGDTGVDLDLNGQISLADAGLYEKLTAVNPL